MKIQYVLRASGVEESVLTCSQCKVDVEMLARMPLDSVVIDGQQAFVGLCVFCTQELLLGFYKASARASVDAEDDSDEDTEVNEGPKAS